MRKSETTDKIVVALIKVQQELEAVPKKGKNPHFHNEYVKLDDALAEAIPKLNAQGLFLTQTVDNNCLLTTLLHTSSQWIESAIPLINKKGDDQGQGGSITYAKRYGLLSILGIPTEDDDGNIASTEYKKSPGAQTKVAGPLPNRAPGADVTPQSGKWSDYTLKTGKNKGKTLRQLGIDGAFGYRSFIEGLEQKGEKISKTLQDDLKALREFQIECAAQNASHINDPRNPDVETADYDPPKWGDDSFPEEPPF